MKLPTDPAAPTVSIVTISKDDPDGLLRSLASARAQQFADYEHLLVLAGRSREAALPADPRLRLVDAAAPGISQALNAGVQAARGTWVQFLNGGDTYADAGSLGAMVERADAQVTMVCAFARVLQRDFTIPRRALRPGRDGFLYISHQATLFRRALFDAHGLFEPGVRIHMDLEWLARLPPDLPYAFLPRETIHFDPHGVSATQVVEASMEEVRILWRRPSTRARVPLVLLLLLPFRVLRRELRRWSGS